MLGEAVRQGFALGFMTFTIRHHQGNSLKEVWDAARRAWARATEGKGWQSVKGSIEGVVRVWEVTIGANGWHVHVHAVLVLREGADFARIAEGMYARWRGGAAAAGFEALRVGQDWRIVRGDRAADDLGGYLSKLSDSANDIEVGQAMGLELTYTQPGRAAKWLRTAPVWSILDELVRTGEASLLGQWHEWERGSKGKRQIGWTRGLRERFAPQLEEVTDDEIVSEELGSAEDGVARWSTRQWAEFVRVPERLVLLLEAGERSRQEALALLDQWGVSYETVTMEVQQL